MKYETLLHPLTALEISLYKNKKSSEQFSISKINKDNEESDFNRTYEKILNNQIYKIKYPHQKTIIFCVKENHIVYYNKDLKITSKGSIEDFFNKKKYTQNCYLKIHTDYLSNKISIPELKAYVYLSSDKTVKSKYKFKKFFILQFEENNKRISLRYDKDFILFNIYNSKNDTEKRILIKNKNSIFNDSIKLPLFMKKYATIKRITDSLEDYNVNFNFVKSSDFDFCYLKDNNLLATKREYSWTRKDYDLTIRGINSRLEKEFYIDKQHELYAESFLTSDIVFGTEKIAIYNSENKKEKVYIDCLTGIRLEKNIYTLFAFLQDNSMKTLNHENLQLVALLDDNLYADILGYEKNVLQALPDKKSKLNI